MPRRNHAVSRVLSVADLDQILTMATPKLRALVSLMADSGLRRAEVAALRWDDIDGCRILVRNGKGSEARVTFIGDLTLEFLNDWAGRSKRRQVGSLSGLTAWGVTSACRRASERSGIRFSSHDLRRYFATQLARNEVNAFVLQRLMGHANISTTLGYLTLAAEDLQAVYTSPVGGAGVR
jgi:integrase/recombinase XerD